MRPHGRLAVYLGAMLATLGTAFGSWTGPLAILPSVMVVLAVWVAVSATKAPPRLQTTGKRALVGATRIGPQRCSCKDSSGKPVAPDPIEVHYPEVGGVEARTETVGWMCPTCKEPVPEPLTETNRRIRADWEGHTEGGRCVCPRCVTLMLARGERDVGLLKEAVKAGVARIDAMSHGFKMDAAGGVLALSKRDYEEFKAEVEQVTAVKEAIDREERRERLSRPAPGGRRPDDRCPHQWGNVGGGRRTCLMCQAEAPRPPSGPGAGSTVHQRPPTHLDNLNASCSFCAQPIHEHDREEIRAHSGEVVSIRTSCPESHGRRQIDAFPMRWNVGGEIRP